MRTLALLALTMTLMCGPAVADGPATSRPAAELSKQSFSRDVTQTFSGRYLLYLPPAYSQDGDKRWPLIVYLHGADGGGTNLDTLRGAGPLARIQSGRELPFIVVVPQCRPNEHWDPANLSALLEEMCEKHRVDETRIYVTGVSMGAGGTWDLAAAYPYRLAAIVPVSGGGQPEIAPRIAHIPTWVFHGAKDNTIPLKYAREMADALRGEGGQPQMTVYPDRAHNISGQVYTGDELYDWLSQQQLAVPPLTIDAAGYRPGSELVATLYGRRYRPIDTAVRLPGGQQRRLQVTRDGAELRIPIPADTTGAVRIDLLLDGRGQQTFWVQPAEMTVPRVGGLRMDGRVGDWPATSSMMSMLARDEASAFVKDLRLGWSPEGLYIAASFDGERLQPNTFEGFWMGVNMEMFLDSAGVDGQGWPATSHQFLCIPRRDGERWAASVGQWRRSAAIADHLLPDERCAAGLHVADGIATMEWFVAADALGASPAAGGQWRLGLVIKGSQGYEDHKYLGWPLSKERGLIGGGVATLGVVTFADHPPAK